MLLALMATGCDARLPQDEMVGVGITGIDHLPDHLSIQDFWVNGYNAAQAGKGGSTVCCAMLPARWRPGLTVQVRWGITNWRDKTYSMHEATVPVEHYDEVGRLWVHFLKDGSVRVVSSNLAAWKQHADYPGPHDPIPQKEPWKMYPRSEGEPLFREVEDASKEADDGRSR
ncbi:hypothetical protein GCM10022229_21720 [Luteimonas lutimaris]|uniref:DUF3304 domain-containing protein n=2 Tax=Luteimonas lutimaris TaxID=698645 RepID=A0ABP7MP24_9GAMM